MKADWKLPGYVGSQADGYLAPLPTAGATVMDVPREGSSDYLPMSPPRNLPPDIQVHLVLRGWQLLQHIRWLLAERNLYRWGFLPHPCAIAPFRGLHPVTRP